MADYIDISTQDGSAIDLYGFIDPPTGGATAGNLYFYFSAMNGDLVYSNKATYDVSGYESLGQQTNMNPGSEADWVINHRSAIVTVSKDESMTGKITGLTSMSYMFINCGMLTDVDLSGFDMSTVTSTVYMFSGCNNLNLVPFGFDTSAVTAMDYMFKDCSSTNLDLSGLDTSAVASMKGMFYNCDSLISLDLSNFDTSSVVDMQWMFSGCRNLISLDLSDFDTSYVRSMKGIFNLCTNLRLITITNYFKVSSLLSELPADQYYPAAGGSPVAKASLTAGTWVRDEADLTKVTSIVQQAQMSQAISRRIGDLRRDLEAQIREASALLDQLDFAAGGLIPVENGGTGATTAAQARTNLGAASASDLQSVQDSLSHYVTTMAGTEITSASVAGVSFLPVQLITNLRDGSSWQFVVSRDSLFLYEGNEVVSTWDRTR